MYVPPYLAQALMEDRIREAQKYAAHNRVVRELSQSIPTVSVSLMQRIGQWMHRSEQPKDVRDVRRAHAV